MIRNGFLKVLVHLDKMVDYWHQMLKEFPEHPAASRVSAAAPLSLYGALVSVHIQKMKAYNLGFISQSISMTGFQFQPRVALQVTRDKLLEGPIWPFTFNLIYLHASKTLE